MDETYIKVAGQWKYLYRAARAFFERAFGLHDVPEKVAVDKSGSNTAAIASIQADSGLMIMLRQSK